MHPSDLNIAQSFWLILVAFLIALIAKGLKVSYPLALVVAGVVIGLWPFLPQAHLEPSLLFTVFLTSLLFEAAINLKISDLKRD